MIDLKEVSKAIFNEEKNISIRALYYVLSKSKERDVLIFTNRFDKYKPKTLKVLSDEFGISTSRITQIEKKFIRILRHPINSRLLLFKGGPTYAPAKRKKEIKYICVKDVQIKDLDLNIRSRKCLKTAGIENLSQLLEKSKRELMGIPNFGRKSLNLINEALYDADINVKI